jgi:hypothetical protein
MLQVPLGLFGRVPAYLSGIQCVCVYRDSGHRPYSTVRYMLLLLWSDTSLARGKSFRLTLCPAGGQQELRGTIQK